MSSNSTLLVPNSTTNDQAVDNATLNNGKIALYTLTIVLGIPGNSMVIWVTGVKLKAKVTHVWLVNLAVADLIFCFTRIFSVVQICIERWPFSDFVCKFSGFVKYANMFCSVFLLAVISLDRVLCVWRPFFTRRRRTLLLARIVVVCVWTLAIIFSTPFLFYKQVPPDNNNTKCLVKDTNVALYPIRFVCGFLVPFMIILVCYILAGVGIKRTRLSGKSRPLRILALLVIAFFLCWAPYHCLQLVKMVDRENKVVKIWKPVASCIASFNSCVNPILYYCMGVYVRRRFGLSGMYKK